MSLSSLQLDAFQCVAKTLNLSRAAKELHLTQSALTQRIQNLEEALGLTLFVRHPRGVRPTLAGERLLRYCQARSKLEEEVLEDLKGEEGPGLGGALRLAGYSTVLRSVILAALAPLLRANRSIQPFLFDAEVRQLPDLLLRGEADYIVIDRPIVRADVETVHLGDEDYVLVRGLDPRAQSSVTESVPRPDLYLDHDPDDTTTLEFLRQQATSAPAGLRRGYFDDIYGVMDGVAHGLGQAVIPRHLATPDVRLRIVDGLTPVPAPVYLQFFKQPAYTRLHIALLAALQQGCEDLLRG